MATKLERFLTNYQNGQVQVSQDVSYELRQTVEENYRLFNSKFEDVKDSSGLTKIFYNISWVIYRTILYASDIDMKHLNFRSLNGKGIKTLALLKLAFKSFLKQIFFGKKIDEIMAYMIWFGTAVTKRVDGDVFLVDLRNYVTTPHIKDPQEREHAEICFYTYDQIMSHKDDWKDFEDVEKSVEKLQEEGQSKFKIIEFWTFEDGHKVCKKYFDRTESKPEDLNQVEGWNPHIEVDTFKTPYKKRRPLARLRKKLGEEEELFPYEQVDFMEVPGRWMAFGVGELLSGLMAHYNEKWNLYRKKDILDLRGIFVHKRTDTSDSLTQEFLDNLETGDVLSMSVEEDLQRLIIDTKTGEFIASIDKIYELARMIMGVTAQSAGEEMPSMTATQSLVNKQAQQTTYDYVREKMHHYLTRLFQNGYMREIIEQIDEEEMVAIVGDPRQLVELDKFFVENLMNQWALDYKNQTGMYPSQEIYDQTFAQLMQAHDQHGDMRFVELKKSILKDLEFYIGFDLTNETIDRGVKIQNLLALKQNTKLSTKRIDEAVLDLMDENPLQFEKTAEEKQEEMEMAQQQMMMEQGGREIPAPVSDVDQFEDANSPMR